MCDSACPLWSLFLMSRHPLAWCLLWSLWGEHGKTELGSRALHTPPWELRWGQSVRAPGLTEAWQTPGRS